MQLIVDHWFELTSTALLGVIAIKTFDSNGNNSTIVEQPYDIIRGSLVARQARRCVPSQPRAIGIHPPSGGRNEE